MISLRDALQICLREGLVADLFQELDDYWILDYKHPDGVIVIGGSPIVVEKKTGKTYDLFPPRDSIPESIYKQYDADKMKPIPS